MSNIVLNSQLTINATLRVDEEELRALDALTGYGAETFLQAFYEKLGVSYLEPHEKGLRSLFHKIRSEVPTLLHRVDAVRKEIK